MHRREVILMSHRHRQIVRLDDDLLHLVVVQSALTDRAVQEVSVSLLATRMFGLLEPGCFVLVVVFEDWQFIARMCLVDCGVV